jgi:hypothetical protein
MSPSHVGGLPYSSLGQTLCCDCTLLRARSLCSAISWRGAQLPHLLRPTGVLPRQLPAAAAAAGCSVAVCQRVRSLPRRLAAAGCTYGKRGGVTVRCCSVICCRILHAMLCTMLHVPTACMTTTAVHKLIHKCQPSSKSAMKCGSGLCTGLCSGLQEHAKRCSALCCSLSCTAVATLP